jgi:hypothetical protein
VSAIATVLWIVVESYVTISMIASLVSRNVRLMSLRWLDMSITIAAYTRRRSDRTFSMSRELSISAISIRGGGEQDVDAGRVAPEHVGQVGLGDPVGGQVEDGRRVDRDLQERAQVAKLQAAVDEHRLLGRAGRARPRG